MTTHPELGAAQFSQFFRELRQADSGGSGYDPYPWQQRLCEQVLSSGWSPYINLPTGAGKTSVLEIAVFALASEADLPWPQRNSPTRMFFVIDRRIVVDEADRKATRLAMHLQQATDPSDTSGFAKRYPTIATVAHALLRMAQSDGRSADGQDSDVRPLEVHSLRGGFYRTNEWAQSLVQPTIVTSTVDQIGSRLLFRGYGISPSARPLQAALVGHDSLIILDEAHTAAAMANTVQTIAQFQSLKQRPTDNATNPDTQQATRSLPTRSLKLVQMTATLPATVSAPLAPAESLRGAAPAAPDVFRLVPADDLSDDSFQFVRAYFRSKPIVLSQANASGKNASKQLAKDLLGRVQSWLAAHPSQQPSLANSSPADSLAVPDAAATEPSEATAQPALAVVVNRVATARQLYALLAEAKKLDVDVQLMIGQMRPIDRDRLGRNLALAIGTGQPRQLAKPLVVVATQCLEVGADLDFDGMISEAASIDALRQRFGRLNRAGRPIAASGQIVIRADQHLSTAKPAALNTAADADPVYGRSLAQTYLWLQSVAGPEDLQNPTVDFGLSAMDSLWQSVPTTSSSSLQSTAEDFCQSDLLIETPQIASLMPAHVDLFSQTYQLRRHLSGPESVGPAAGSSSADSRVSQVSPDPDVSLFLHGRQQRPTDVTVCWRHDLCEWKSPPKSEDSPAKRLMRLQNIEAHADLPALSAEERLVSAVTELPPTSPECMSVGWRAIRQFLSDGELIDDADQALIADTDSFTPKGRPPGFISPDRRPVVWRGPDQTFVCGQLSQIRPGDTLVFPTTAGGWSLLGHLPGVAIDPALQPLDPTNTDVAAQLAVVDVADPAYLASHWKPLLRLPSGDVEIGDTNSESSDLLARSAGKLNDWQRRVLDWMQQQLPSITPESRLSRTGYILRWSKSRLPRESVLQLLSDPSADTDTASWVQPDIDFTDASSSKSARSVLLADHSAAVAQRASQIAAALGFDEWQRSFHTAGMYHDLGKADPRFQSMLWGRAASESWLVRKLFAKSQGLATAAAARNRDWQRSCLPRGFRHELLSSQLAQQLASLDEETLHLIEAHHGFARPWFPAWTDQDAAEVDLQSLGVNCQLTVDARQAADSQLRIAAAERFWSLQNRYGVWQTALLESILRLADQQISREESNGATRSAPPTDFKNSLPPTTATTASASPNASPASWRLRLIGLDGGNPLALLAALGLLRLLNESAGAMNCKMHWQVTEGCWTPVLTSHSPLATNEWFDSWLAETAGRDLAPILATVNEGNGKIITSPDQFSLAVQHALQKFLMSETPRSDCDFLTSLASEMSRRIELKKETDGIEYSELYMTRGSGHQRMLELAGNIRQATTRDHLNKAILEPWRYDDPGKSMNLRWDPLDDRQYAKRWLNPSNDPSQTVWGANDLAMDALPLFPTAIVNGRLETTAFHRVRKQGTFFTWPIWTQPLSLPVIQSLLQWSEWQAATVDEQTLESLAINHVRKVQRVRNDKFFNFSMSTTAST